eukprot:3752667-Pyramimonas_sp.AAC.1
MDMIPHLLQYLHHGFTPLMLRQLIDMQGQHAIGITSRTHLLIHHGYECHLRLRTRTGRTCHDTSLRVQWVHQHANILKVSWPL